MFLVRKTSLLTNSRVCNGRAENGASADVFWYEKCHQTYIWKPSAFSKIRFCSISSISWRVIFVVKFVNPWGHFVISPEKTPDADSPGLISELAVQPSPTEQTSWRKRTLALAVDCLKCARLVTSKADLFSLHFTLCWAVKPASARSLTTVWCFVCWNSGFCAELLNPHQLVEKVSMTDVPFGKVKWFSEWLKCA